MFTHGREAKIHLAFPAVVLFGVTVVVISLMGIVAPGGSEIEEEPVLFEEALPGNGNPVSDLPALLEESTHNGGESEKESLVWVEGLEEPGAAPAFESLSGHVIDENGTPVGDAEVRATRIKTLEKTLRPDGYVTFTEKSETDGSFLFHLLPVGTYLLVAVKGESVGHVSAFAAGSKSHPRGESLDHEIMLKLGGNIAGRVLDPEGKALAGAFVVPSEMHGVFAATDDQGAFTLRSLEAGIYSLHVGAKGLAPKTVRNVFTGKTDLEISLNAGGSISGKITLDGEPKAGIVVAAKGSGSDSVFPAEAVSRKDGTYTLAPLEEGRYNPCVPAREFSARSRSGANIGKGENLEGIDFSLDRHGSLAGRVVDEETGESLPGAWVCVYQMGRTFYRIGFELGNVRTDHDGCFHFPSLPPTQYAVGVKCDDGHVSTLWERGRKATIKSEEHLEGIEVRLKKGAPATVKITGESGESIAGAKITLRCAERKYNYSYNSCVDQLLPKAVETEQGVYGLTGLDKGVYNVTVERRGWIRKTETLAIGEGEETSTLDMVLSPAFAVEGKVLNTGGKGIAQAYVRVSNDSKGITDGTGKFTLTGLSPGRQYFRVSAEGYLRLSQRHEVKEEMIGPGLELTLIPKGTLQVSGKAINDLGEPVAGLIIRVSQGSGGSYLNENLTTEEDGSFLLEGVAEGQVYLRPDWNRGNPRTENVKAQAGQTDVEVVIERFARVKGKVVDTDNEPIPSFDARSIQVGSWRYSDSVVSFEGGEFDLKKVMPGEVQIYASTIDNKSGHSETFKVGPGEVREGILVTLSEKGSVAGMVRDAATFKPIEGANVQAAPRLRTSYISYGGYYPSAVTGEDGTFTVDDVKTGAVNVVVTHPDYSHGITEGVHVEKNKVTEGIQVFMRRGSAIVGHVFEKGVAKAGVQIQARMPGQRRISSVSGKEGFYEIKNVKPGTYKISASLTEEDEGTTSIERSVTVYEGECATCNLTFIGGASITGTVYLFGVPMKGVNVSAYVRKSEEWAWTSPVSSSSRGCVTGENGFYKIAGLYSGRYRVSASYRGSEGSYSASREVEVAGGAAMVDFRIGDGETGEIYGTVFENGLPAPKISLYASASGFSQRGTTDTNGFYRLTNLPAGKVSLNVSMSGSDFRSSSRITRSVTLEPGTVLREDIFFTTGNGVLCGTVRVNSGIESWNRLSVQQVKEKGTAGLSMNVYTEKGKYRLNNLAPGCYVVTLSSPWAYTETAWVYDHQETELNFDIKSGMGRLKGHVTGPAEKEKGGEITVYLFPPGKCQWKKGQSFHSYDTGGGYLHPCEPEGGFQVLQPAARNL